jgi:hypothetical protein
MPTDYLVDCADPSMFDNTIQKLGTAMLFDGGNKGDYKKVDGYYLMRVYANEGYIEFAIKNQGYGTIVKKFDTLQ